MRKATNSKKVFLGFLFTILFIFISTSTTFADNGTDNGEIVFLCSFSSDLKEGEKINLCVGLRDENNELKTSNDGVKFEAALVSSGGHRFEYIGIGTNSGGDFKYDKFEYTAGGESGKGIVIIYAEYNDKTYKKTVEFNVEEPENLSENSVAEIQLLCSYPKVLEPEQKIDLCVSFRDKNNELKTSRDGVKFWSSLISSGDHEIEYKGYKERSGGYVKYDDFEYTAANLPGENYKLAIYAEYEGKTYKRIVGLDVLRSDNGDNNSSNAKENDIEYEDEIVTGYDYDHNPFSDTTLSTLEGKAAAYLWQKKISGGYPDGEFKGDQDVNRAEAAKFLLLSRYGQEKIGDIDNNGVFLDVKNGEWYTKYVMKAYQLGIIKGYDDGTFRPGNTVNTVEFLAMLAETFNLDLDLPYSYSDIESGSWYEKYAGIAEKYNLFPNIKTKLNPGKLLNRNEVAVAIYQFLNSGY